MKPRFYEHRVKGIEINHEIFVDLIKNAVNETTAQILEADREKVKCGSDPQHRIRKK